MAFASSTMGTEYDQLRKLRHLVHAFDTLTSTIMLPQAKAADERFRAQLEKEQDLDARMNLLQKVIEAGSFDPMRQGLGGMLLEKLVVFRDNMLPEGGVQRRTREEQKRWMEASTAELIEMCRTKFTSLHNKLFDIDADAARANLSDGRTGYKLFMRPEKYSSDAWLEFVWNNYAQM